MVDFAFVDQNGCPTGGGSTPGYPPDGAVVLPTRDILARLGEVYLQDGDWRERPKVPPPQIDGGRVTVANLPAGTAVQMANSTTGEPVAWSNGEALAKGSYFLSVTPPAPWIGIEARIDIDGGDGAAEMFALNAHKAAASAAVVSWAEQFLNQFTAGYPRQETLAWGAKLAAARRVIAGEHDALIAVEAEALGVHVLTLALRVNVLGSRYEQIVALTSAIRGATQARIAAAPDAAALPSILEDAKATAEAALARITAGQ